MAYEGIPPTRESCQFIKLGHERPLRVATSTSERNILFSNRRAGDVEDEGKTEDLLFRNPKGVDVGSLAER